ncbi:MAG TPA: hypothetical protein VLG74_02155 [Blastocatellia bacterium]|nr:hypothetical protein [Blastocatellia bacterium]
MGRILLILTAGCLFATFLIIANSSFKTNSSASPKSEVVSKKAEKDRPKKGEQSARAKSARKDAVKRSKQSGPGNPDEAPMSIARLPERESIQDDGLATLSGDAPVYSVNSRDSRIIKVLKKGEKVATDLQVIDEQGRWTIIKKPDLSKPGFVLDEHLQPSNPKRKADSRP